MGLGGKAGATGLVYCTPGAPAEEQARAWCCPLAGHSTELVGGRGNQEAIGAVVAGARLPRRHREAEALQEAGEEEEELHAGQGLPEA